VVQALHGPEQTGGGGAPATPDSAPIHPLFGERYAIEKEIGRGGMGRVFSAVDLRLGRRVAVKVLAPGAHGDEQLRRFQVEARAAASLQQPNILDVFDVGIDGGEPYIVSELLEGATLRERLAGPLAVPEALRYARQLAAGLAAAHANGVVHRDLKPENLFLTRDDRLKILDFGIAKLLPSGPPGGGPEGSSTASGAIVGTTAYMSPEQVRGASVDPRSDVFSFGAILYEMLTGSPAFRGGSAVETGYAVLSSVPGELPRNVPQELSLIVSRCLEKDPADRYEDAAALAKDLEKILPGGPAARSWRTPRSVPWVIACAAAAALLVLNWPRPPTSAIASDRQLAVLPFRSVGGGAPQDAFAAGLSEILTNKLRQIEQYQGTLAVVSAGEVLKENVAGARAAREAFGATIVLGGSVHWSDATALVALDLVETRNQLVLAARDVEVPKDQLANLQTLLVQKAAEMLDVQVQPAARRALGGDATSAAAAYEFYLQGRGYLQRYDRVENVESAVRVFDQAIAIDGSYALAHAGKAEALLRLFQISRDPEVVVRAGASASRAVELNAGLAPVHVTMGLVHLARGRQAAAIASLQRALVLEPRSGDALRELANAYEAAGRYADAEATYRRAIDLRQNSWAAYKDLAVFLNQRGRLAESVPYFERVVALTPDNYSGYSNLGGIYLRLVRVAEAERMLRKSISLRPSANAYTNLGSLAYYMRHDYAQASEMYRQATELNANDDRLWGALADSYRWTPGREGDAAAAFRRALALTDRQGSVDPSDAQLLSRRALYWSALGDHARAKKEIARALDSSPGNGQVLFRAAIVHEQAGRREQALRVLESALRAGFSLNEIVNAPPLRALREDPAGSRLIAEHRAGTAAPRR
jgi:tetratricopeptide (TPR) repeat protein/TolB-like protein